MHKAITKQQILDQLADPSNIMVGHATALQSKLWKKYIQDQEFASQAGLYICEKIRNMELDNNTHPNISPQARGQIRAHWEKILKTIPSTNPDIISKERI